MAFTLRLDGEIHTLAKLVAEVDDMSLQKLVRRALEGHLNARLRDDGFRQRARGLHASAGDRLKRLLAQLGDDGGDRG